MDDYTKNFSAIKRLKDSMWPLVCPRFLKLHMKVLLVIAILLIPNIGNAQKLSRNLTCQDLIDFSNGIRSRRTDDGTTLVPVNEPKPRGYAGYALLSHATELCHRLSRKEITVGEFDALYAERAYQLRLDIEKVKVERQKILMQQKNLENQQRSLQNQLESLRNQRAAIQTQRNAVQAQREAARVQALRAEIARRQQEIQHQQVMVEQRLQTQQLQQIRLQGSQSQSFTCTGGGGIIHCF